jgi:hypothetical protein
MDQDVVRVGSEGMLFQPNNQFSLIQADLG